MKMVDFIVCDDIRQEIMNKVTLVGIYSDKIVLPPNTNFPAKLRLAFFSRLIHEKADPPFDGFQVVLSNNDREVTKVDGRISGRIPVESPMVINFVLPEFPVFATGEISAKFNFLNKGEVVFELAPVAPTGITESEQPKNLSGAPIN